MPVSIGQQDSQYYVQLSRGEKSVKIPCKDETEAKTVAQEATLAEQRIIEEEKQKAQGQNQTASVAQGTPPEGVGGKLDTAA